MDIFIASFKSAMYPEDDCILGAYTTEEKAERAIERAMANDASSYPKHPLRYQQKRYYYDIKEMTLDIDG
jgi:hypothetical protein